MLEIETVSMHDYINIWDHCGINTTHGEEISWPHIDANFGIKNSREWMMEHKKLQDKELVIASMPLILAANL